MYHNVKFLFTLALASLAAAAMYIMLDSAVDVVLRRFGQ